MKHLTKILGFFLLLTLISQAHEHDHGEIKDFFPKQGNKQHPHRSNTRKLPLGNNLTENNVFKLESFPSSTHLIYLDFDGEDVSNWKFSGVSIVDSADISHEEIRVMWEVVAADFLTFDVNVTTNREVYDNWDPSKKMMCAFGLAFAMKYGGVAYPNTFGTGIGCLVNLKHDKGYYSAHVACHELGHSLGLTHDGSSWPGPVTEYYGSHADWGPIMGAGFGAYRTWSKGEYEYASNLQDDIAIMGSKIGYRSFITDEIEPIVIDNGNQVKWTSNNGLIASNQDVDTLSFELETDGVIDLHLGTAVDHTNLDILATLVDHTFSPIQSSSPLLDRGAHLQTNLLAGRYYIIVEATGENTATTGFTDYSSFGYYEIDGIIDGAKKSDIDLSILALEGFENKCGDSTTGKVLVTNNGTQTIQSAQITINLNGTFYQSITMENILPQENRYSSAIQFSSLGENQIEATGSIQGNQTETILVNNTSLKNYNLTSGEELTVTSSLPTYSGDNPFIWTIEDDNQNVLVTGENINTLSSNSETNQNFCLTQNCYSFSVEGIWNMCSEYDNYVPGTYTAGEQVNYQGKIYEAKWWTTKTPGTNDWNLIKNCNTTPYNTKLIRLSDQKELVSLSSSDPLDHSEEFCTNNTVSINKTTLYTTRVFPNPVQDHFTIESTEIIESLRVLDSSGKVVSLTTPNTFSFLMDTESWPKGYYFLLLSTPLGSKTLSIIK